jgi:hypothetical protein
MIRHEVFAPDVQVNDLHHNSVYQRELVLAKDFVKSLASALTIDPCPVSGKERHEIFFGKWGRRYAFCPDTWSLCLDVVPDDVTLHRYFFDSDLARYRATDEYQTTFTQLRQNLWAAQIEWIEGRIRRYLGMDTYLLTDWGPRMQGWVTALGQAPFLSRYMVAEPLPPVVPTKDPETSHVILLFDVIQRSPDPAGLLAKAYNALQPGGILLLTCRSGSGFDVLTLAGESDSIFPLDHICLPSPQGMQLLLEQAGFEILEMTTPGLLDVKLVKQSARRLPVQQYFQRYVMEQFPDEVHERLQGFLQQNNLSSHLRVVGKKSKKLEARA